MVYNHYREKPESGYKYLSLLKFKFIFICFYEELKIEKLYLECNMYGIVITF